MIVRRGALVALLLVLVGSGAARAEKQKVVIEDVSYRTTEAAQAAWNIGHRDSPAIGLVKVAGRKLLRMPCNFSTNNEWRVAWDLRGQWNLSGIRELTLEFAPGNNRGLGLTIYLHNADGWYAKRCFLPVGGRDITIGRHEFQKDRQPGHLDSVDRLRISIRRDKSEDTEVRLAGIHARSYPAQVAVYQSEAGTQREPGTPRFVRVVTDTLERLGVDFELVSDKGVANGRLAGKKVAILPLNAVIPPDAGKALKRFVGKGGKLIACYSLPAPLGELLRVRSAGSIDGRENETLTAILFQDGKDRQAIRIVQNSWMARKLAPETDTRVVGTWVDGKGKVSEVPAVTRNANGYFVGHVFTRDDPAGKDEALIEMLSQLWPGVWKGLYEHKLDGLGKVAGLSGVEELRTTALKNVADDAERTKRVSALLKEADALRRWARATSQRDDGRLAHQSIRQAHEKLTSAYAVSIPSRAGEVRAVWCHSPEGVKDMTWDESMKGLAESGFNTLIVNMCWGDGAAYPSKVLPMVTRADELAKCLRAAKKHGISVHVWRVNWRFWHGSPRAFREKMGEAGRLQQDADGKKLDWLCPSHPANRQLEIDSMLEIVRNYDVAGIHFDYIRYPGMRGCYCEECRRRFEGRYTYAEKVRNWPQDVITGKFRERYLQFRRDNITRVVAEVSAQVRKMKPNVKISAAVFWNWTSARDNNGQDWKLWVEKGYLDFVCPMQYTTDPVLFEHQLQNTTRWVAGRIPLIPGIGATLGQSADGTLEQVLIARRYKTAGFVLFNYSRRLAEEHLPLLREGATAK